MPFAQLLADGHQQGFCIIGIIGAQGLGKSTLGNALLGLAGGGEGTAAAAATTAMAAEASAGVPVAASAGGGAFATRDGPAWQGRHCTVGADIRVSAATH